MTLFRGIDTVFYQVCNMDQSVAFYEGTLGLTLTRREGNDWAEFQVGDLTLSLSGELATRPHSGGATVVLTAADIAVVDKRLGESDVQRGPVEEMGGALMLQFFDPDGNELVAMQPPTA